MTKAGRTNWQGQKTITEKMFSPVGCVISMPSRMPAKISLVLPVWFVGWITEVNLCFLLAPWDEN